MKKTKTFFLNGEEYVSDQQVNLSDLITYFNYNASLLVLEYNHSICQKKNWATVFINDKDKIEIVTIVGGG
jgi:thiamine biosynthesis protein ThiS|uniref:Thiamine biosynthesis protein n=1 Tax=Thalassiosira pseudonana TaxID=35128 RepID=A0T0W8_THAPS|nr:thiamine biosynthesis protein [Thalassiosira pseudonana]ABK20803.1 thiamine biosynthesis protein [Thalassiosira pseudonana]QWM93075.1 thiamine biosynthesis protein S [Thalassiosira pseudonana]